ncbi:helix-hairpin-helix domain-containing protein [Oceanobacillus salinisoli]|uniref:helix-hairpin-helix domain-containing protein n=1 Tax=Oceanobacillus salinisoli TaxID=2678611 RepID=UPI0012E2DBD3|nr:helix-hairpin-helix domain-containing protein [Oceanobacillus salinisoli]
MIELLKKNLFFLIIGAVTIFIIIFSREDTFNNESLNPAVSTDGLNTETLEMKSEEQLTQEILVDVKGAIIEPGVYEMKAGDRVNDVIDKAGGFTKEADQTQVNLAQKVHDEMIVMVPAIAEQGSETIDSVSNHGKVRLNYATQEEIESLTGIGPSKAQAIIQHREEKGYFKSVEDLLEISGIGEKTLENIQDDIQVP